MEVSKGQEVRSFRLLRLNRCHKYAYLGLDRLVLRVAATTAATLNPTAIGDINVEQ
jgi:hypothetical protein